MFGLAEEASIPSERTQSACKTNPPGKSADQTHRAVSRPQGKSANGQLEIGETKPGNGGNSCVARRMPYVSANKS
jgi:hypothetical protein